MAKKGMKRPDWTHVRPKNDVAPVPEIQGKAKHGKEKANPIISGMTSGTQKVYHTAPYANGEAISSAYSVFDGDLANDNLVNDLSAADLQDL